MVNRVGHVVTIIGRCHVTIWRAQAKVMGATCPHPSNPADASVVHNGIRSAADGAPSDSATMTGLTGAKPVCRPRIGNRVRLALRSTRLGPRSLIVIVADCVEYEAAYPGPGRPSAEHRRRQAVTGHKPWLETASVQPLLPRPGTCPGDDRGSMSPATHHGPLAPLSQRADLCSKQAGGSRWSRERPSDKG
jgi:hypothetical protein